jgi:hypothetical protein
VNLAIVLIVLALVFLMAVVVSARRAAKAEERRAVKHAAIERRDSNVRDEKAGH